MSNGKLKPVAWRLLDGEDYEYNAVDCFSGGRSGGEPLYALSPDSVETIAQCHRVESAMCDQISEQAEEIDRLRAEVERLTKAYAEQADACRARTQTIAGKDAEIARLRAEVERLETSLQDQCIACKWPSDCRAREEDVERLTKERDTEIARNKPLHALIKSIEETKSHLIRKNDEKRDAVSTLDSERSANEQLTNAIAQQVERIAELERDRKEDAGNLAKLLRAVKYFIGIAERGTGNSCPVDQSAESFVLEYVKGLESLIAAKSAALAKAQRALRMVGQSLAWLAFGECRSYGEGVPLLKSHEADATCKEALASIGALGQAEGKELRHD